MNRYEEAVHDVEAWLRDEAKRLREESCTVSARELERVADQLANFALAPRTPERGPGPEDAYARASSDLEMWMHLEAQDARGTQRGVRLEWIAQSIARGAFRPSPSS